MLGPFYNTIGNLLSEDRPGQKQEDEVLEDPEEFSPGFLFDISASWILLVRRLLIPEYARTREPPGCSAICKCGRNKSSSSTTPKKRKGFSWRC